MLARLSFALAVLATPALGCPTAADLQDGIQIVIRKDFGPSIFRYSLHESGAVLESESIGSNGSINTLYTNGLNPIRFFRLAAASGTPQDVATIVQSFQLALPLNEAQSAQGEITYTDESGKADVYATNVNIGPEVPLVIDGCTYTSIGISRTMSVNGEVQLQRYGFLPDLGITLPLGWYVPQANRQGVYKPLSIEEVRK